jgi:hypothetical protein
MAEVVESQQLNNVSLQSDGGDPVSRTKGSKSFGG